MKYDQGRVFTSILTKTIIMVGVRYHAQDRVFRLLFIDNAHPHPTHIASVSEEVFIITPFGTGWF